MTIEEGRQRVVSTIKDNWLIVLSIVFLIILLFLIGIWVFHPSIEVVGESGTDFVEKVIDKAIGVNVNDYSLWYKTNMLLQGSLIITALLATIFAAFTTKENADVLKKFSIFLTAVTAGLTAIQSTFHIRENIDVFIRVNSDLQTLEIEYLRDRAPFTRSEAAPNDIVKSPELLKLQSEALKRYVSIQTERMRAYASVGAQSPATNLPSPETANRQVEGSGKP